MTLCLTGQSAPDPRDFPCSPAVRRIYLGRPREADPRPEALLRRAYLRARRGYAEVRKRYPVPPEPWREPLARWWLERAILPRLGPLREALHEADAEVVLALGPMAGIRALFAARPDQRVIVSERNDPELQPKLYPLSLLRAVYFRRADVVTANSHHALDALRPYVEAEKLLFLPNPLAEPAHAARAPIPPPSFLAAGRLVPQKNYEVLLRALSLLPRRLHHWRLVVLGKGPERRRLHAWAARLGVADRVAWEGLVPHPEAYYRAADVFVLASHFEGQSNALLEAMRSGLPVVVSDTPGNTEIVTHERTGLVTPAGDARALARALTRLADDADLRHRLGTAAPDVAARYALDRVLPIWDGVVDRALISAARRVAT